MDSDKPVNRRRFFREGLREFLKPLSHVIEPIEHAARQLDRLDRGSPENPNSGNSILDQSRAPLRPMPRTFPLNIVIRPPGALDESKFLDTCSRCGECVRVCPVQCIKIDPAGIRGGGAPYIVADEKPCVACDGLLCMPACPTGALVPTLLAGIDMGLADWHSDTCVRSHGQDCTICVDRCPLGSFAIELIGNAIKVHEKGCIGCGVCQHDCPTSPKSIVVVPKIIVRKR